MMPVKKKQPEPKFGQVWRDLDKRMMLVNRRVRIALVAFGHVTYREVIGANNREETRLFRSKVDRFRRTFELLEEPA